MSSKPFLKALKQKKTDTIPFWFMRQAGRYLPEYRALREKAGSFLNLAYNPDFASEITMQPIRRFNMDAAIIFSDILVIPHALGQSLNFIEGEGPKLGKFNIDELNYLQFDKTLNSIYLALEKTKYNLKKEGFEQTALIGFAGSPWTVSTYMIEGGSSRDFLITKNYIKQETENYQKLIDLIIEATTKYLINQIKAGAEAIQLFDSWASALDGKEFEQWVILPNLQIIKNIKSIFPDIPIIGFPRAINKKYLTFTQKTKVSGISLDQNIDLLWAVKNLQPLTTIQGNLDPQVLKSGNLLEQTTKKILDTCSKGPFIFNLGHGIDKETPIEHIEILIKVIKGYRVYA